MRGSDDDDADDGGDGGREANARVLLPCPSRCDDAAAYASPVLLVSVPWRDGSASNFYARGEGQHDRAGKHSLQQAARPFGGVGTARVLRVLYNTTLLHTLLHYTTIHCRHANNRAEHTDAHAMGSANVTNEIAHTARSLGIEHTATPWEFFGRRVWL